jgi:hypothetical protein
MPTLPVPDPAAKGPAPRGTSSPSWRARLEGVIRNGRRIDRAITGMCAPGDRTARDLGPDRCSLEVRRAARPGSGAATRARAWP